jgi:3-hydroxybutyryl-CoA dehydratase
MNGRSVKDLKIGDFGVISKTLTENDVYNYAGITGDFSWLHVNIEKARKGLFKERVVHGMLTAGMVSAVLGTQVPGPGTIYVSQTLKFLKPVYFNDTVTARAEVVKLDVERDRATLRTTVTNQRGEIVVDGEAVVIPPRPEHEPEHASASPAADQIRTAGSKARQVRSVGARMKVRIAAR